MKDIIETALKIAYGMDGRNVDDVHELQTLCTLLEAAKTIIHVHNS